MGKEKQGIKKMLFNNFLVGGLGYEIDFMAPLLQFSEIKNERVNDIFRQGQVQCSASLAKEFPSPIIINYQLSILNFIKSFNHGMGMSCQSFQVCQVHDMVGIVEKGLAGV